MESDNFIVCREEGQVAMIDLRQGAQVDRKPMQAEAAIMNPAQKILALRSATGGATRLQHFCVVGQFQFRLLDTMAEHSRLN